MALSVTGPAYNPNGTFNREFHATKMGWKQNGMVPMRHCQNQMLTTEQGAFPDGWPCHLGGSIGLTQRNVRSGQLINCMIFYNQAILSPPRVFPWLQQNRLVRFGEAISRCTTQQRFEDPRARIPIQLTLLATCIEDLYPHKVPGPPEGSTGLVTLRGIACIPCAPAGNNVEGLGYELLAPGGHIIERRTDGIAFQDLNVLPLSICYVAMMSAVRG